MPRSAKPKKGAKAPRRVPSEITAERERRAWDLRQQLWTHDQIARELKVSQPAVCQMLRRIQRRVLAELTDEVAEVKARQTAQLERVAADAYQGWMASRRDTVTTRTTPGAALKIAITPKKPAGKAGPMVDDVGSAPGVEVTVKTNAGTPAFLAEVRGALADIRKIWGMDVAADADAADGHPPHPDVVAAMARGIADGLKAAGMIEGVS